MKHISDKLKDLSLQDNTDEPHKRSLTITHFLNHFLPHRFFNQFVPVTIINNIIKIIANQNRYFNIGHNHCSTYVPVSHPAWRENSEFLSR